MMDVEMVLLSVGERAGQTAQCLVDLTVPQWDEYVEPQLVVPLALLWVLWMELLKALPKDTAQGVILSVT